ncbi:MAG TPA: hypothetical protein VFV75_13695 [Candidatus Polarisedimenticolaceae bacterium]|nr:hypothetical protein [Candidatus Polarisedimenticolaceae bacterium]
MLEGVPRSLSVVRETPLGRGALWAFILGSVVLDLTSLRQSQDQRLVTVGALALGSLLVYAIIRLLIARGMASERVHHVVAQLAGFLVLFLGIVAVFGLARALTDRGFAATMAIFHASWALGALDGYRTTRMRVLQSTPEPPALPSTQPLDPDGGWEIRAQDYSRVFQSLKELVGPAATVCVIGASVDEDVASLLSTLSTPETHRLGEVGTWWPRPRVFQIPATEPNLAQLATASAGAAEPEFMEHLVVYEAGINVLEWWDAPNDPIRLAATIPEEVVRRFATRLGAAVVRA